MAGVTNARNAPIEALGRRASGGRGELVAATERRVAGRAAAGQVHDPHERRHLLFRDWLRESAGDCERYETVKRELAAREWVDGNDYADAKSRVVAEIIEHAETWVSHGSPS